MSKIKKMLSERLANLIKNRWSSSSRAENDDNTWKIAQVYKIR